MTPAGRALALVFLTSAGPAARLTAQCPDGSPPPCRQAQLDTAEYVILPLTHREGRDRPVLDGVDCAQLLYQAFAQWRDVRLADNMRVFDALDRLGGRRGPYRISVEQGYAIARGLGAGRLVMGELWQFAETTYVRVGVYDVVRRRLAAALATGRLTRDVSELRVFNSLADSLLIPGLRTGLGGVGSRLTSSRAALLAFQRGVKAVAAWDVGGAARHFRATIAADSGFAQAYLWLGRVLQWADDTTLQARADRSVIAARAERLLPSFGPVDRVSFLAQQALAEGRWPQACGYYQEMLQTDSLNFIAWLGLADCNASDPVLVADPREGGRYVFRGSYEKAATAYRRALLLAPAFNFAARDRPYERLARLLFTEPFRWRYGLLDSLQFVAFPELVAETLAFHPMPISAAARAPPPAGHAAALSRNRGVVVTVASAWVDAYPGAPTAHATLAAALEARGQIAPTTGEPRAALTELAAARRLDRNSAHAVSYAVDGVRLLLKSGDFVGAQRAADSLLRSLRRPAEGLAGIAVLLGRPALAARLTSAEAAAWMPVTAHNEPVSLSLPLARAGLALVAFAAAGAPRESVTALERRIEDLLSTIPNAARRAALQSALLDVPAALVFDVMGARPPHQYAQADGLWLGMQRALVAGDSAAARQRVRQVITARGADPGGWLAPDATYVESWLLVALGDSVAAQDHLDRTLDDLPSLSSVFLGDPAQAGMLTRMMALRADLAAARGDRRTARRWAAARASRWLGAEPALATTAARMRRLAETP